MGWVVNATPRPLYPPGETRYSYRRLGEPQRRSGRVQKISPPTGIRYPDRTARSESVTNKYKGKILREKSAFPQVKQEFLAFYEAREISYNVLYSPPQDTSRSQVHPLSIA
jgi:hypothetical protein